MKQWFVAWVPIHELAEFANENKLLPGEILVLTHEATALNAKVMYYGEKQLY